MKIDYITLLMIVAFALAFVSFLSRVNAQEEKHPRALKIKTTKTSLRERNLNSKYQKRRRTKLNPPVVTTSTTRFHYKGRIKKKKGKVSKQ